MNSEARKYKDLQIFTRGKTKLEIYKQLTINSAVNASLSRSGPHVLLQSLLTQADTPHVI